MNKERTGIITLKGNPATLLGPDVGVGAMAPEFTVVDNGLQPVTLADSKGKIRLITTVPSLDTPTCDTMTRRFNQDCAALPAEVVIDTISLDLPFAQKRWCGNAGIARVRTLSDYRERSFASAYGLMCKELMLLTRAVLIIDRSGKIVYRQIVPEVTAEPDYAATLLALQALL